MMRRETVWGLEETKDRKIYPVSGLGQFGAEIKHRLPSLRALTSLRFFAAVYVVVYHLASGHSFAEAPLVGRIVQSGYTGVPLFFVLSGFILAYNYREVPRPREFYISRFARIYPVYLLALLVSFLYVLAPATPPTDHMWLRLAASATLLQTWYQPFEGSFNGPGWTLSVELIFYALFPFLLGAIRRVTARGFVLFCAAYLAILCVPLAMHGLAPASHDAFATAYYMTKGTVPPVHLPIFMIGVYLGMQYLKPAEARSVWPLIGGCVGSAVLLCSAVPELYVPIRKGLLVMTYAALIYGLASVRRGWMTNRWMVLAGEISFSIYILQIPVMRTAQAATRRLGFGFYANVPVVLVVLIGVSFLAYRYIELPARIAIRGRLTHRPVAVAKI